jgi:hypothetical protein
LLVPFGLWRAGAFRKARQNMKDRAKKIMYEIKNPIKTYQITNRITKNTITLAARSAQEACEFCDWPIGVCYVKILAQ